MIDLMAEHRLSLTAATKEAFLEIDGRRPHVSSIWRWCRKGLRGVKLEYVRCGNRIVTTREALVRFSNRLADVDVIPVPPAQVPPRDAQHADEIVTRRTPAQRERAVNAARERLAAAGLL